MGLGPVRRFGYVRENALTNYKHKNDRNCCDEILPWLPRAPQILGGGCMTVMWVILIALIFGTMPVTIRALYPPLFLRRGTEVRPQVVVVLGAGHRQRAGKYVTGVIGLRRLQHGLVQAQARKLPLLLCGGGKHLSSESPTGSQGDVPSEAALMAEEVRMRAPLQSVWLEEESRTTWENAENAAKLLVRKGVSRVLLVTDRPHMTRAMMCFRAQGLDVEPAPLDRLPTSNWVPTAAALSLMPEIWYEWLALVWYGLHWR